MSLIEVAKRAWWAGAIASAYLVHGVYTGSPIVPRWIVIYALAAGCLIWFARHTLLKRAFNITLSEALIMGLLAYATLTLVWSADWRDGLLTLEAAFALAVVYMGFRRLSLQAQRQIIAVTSVAGFVGALAFGWARQGLYGGFGNENFQAEWMLIALPFLIWTWGSGRHQLWYMRAAALLITPVALYFILFVNLSDSKWVALGAVLLLVCYWLWRRFGFMWAGIAFLLPINVAILSGWLGSPGVQKAIAHRLEIGFNTAMMWWEKPWFGHGMGAFNYEYGRFQEAHLQFWPHLDTVLHPAAIFAGATHNEFLQLASETGVIGLAAALAIVGFVIRSSMKARDGLSVAATFALFIGLGLSTIGFPFQNPASVLAFVLAMGIITRSEAVLFPSFSKHVGHYRLVPLAVITTVVAAFALLYSAAWQWRAETMFAWTRAFIDKGNPTALSANLATYQVYPYEARYRRQLVMTVAALLKTAHGRVVIEPKAADEAYRISNTAAGNMPAIKLVRIEYLLNSGLWEQHAAEMEKTLAYLRTHASRQPSVWIAEGMYRLFLNDADRALKAVALGMALPAAGDYKPQFYAILENLNIEPEKDT